MQPNSRTPRRPRTVLLQGAVVVAVVAILGSLAGRATPSPSAPGFTFATQSAAPAAWAALQLGPDTTLAEVTATRSLGREVATTTAFTIKSLGAIDVADLASRIESDPPVTFAIEPGPAAGTATLVPTSPLREATRYRLRLMAPDGSLAGTWAFRTDSPLRIVGRLPDDRTTNVPVDTGIETTFDQDSPIGFESHFSISPTVAGRFERHERTWVFIPDKPLALKTIYTVTVTHGVRLSGSDQVLEADATWSFETASTSGLDPALSVRIVRPIIEARPGDGPVLAADVTNDTAKADLPYELYRLPTLDAAAAAARTLLADEGWARWSSAGLVDTGGLRRVANGTVRVTDELAADAGLATLRLPVRPDPGIYLVVFPTDGRPGQAILQVTDLAAYVLTTETRTVAWVSDLGSLGPIAGASVAVPGGAALGLTDERGLLTAATPANLVGQATVYADRWYDYYSPQPVRVLTIVAPDGRTLLAPLGISGGDVYPGERNGASAAADPAHRWWLLLSTDRSTYRASDTIHAWGVIRARDDLSVPAGLELRLRLSGAPRDAVLARLPVTATKRGVFSGDLSFQGLPHGSYEVDLFAGDTLVQGSDIQIDEIRKPAYAIQVATDRHAYVAGDRINVSGSVAFYDGSRTPGLALAVTSDAGEATATTDASGAFAATLVATAADRDWFTTLSLSAHPASPEEGRIEGQAYVAVFPSTVWLDGAASLDAGRLSATITLSNVDFPAVEHQLSEGSWPSDPAGAALGGRSVKVVLVHDITTRTQSGTQYDFIAKKVLPVYVYDQRQETVFTRTMTTAADGTIRLDAAVPVATDDYEVIVTAADDQRRSMSRTFWATQQHPEAQPPSLPYLGSVTGCGWYQETAHVGQATSLTVHEADGTVAADGQYLFLVGERGLADAVLQAGSTFERTFSTADLPSYDVLAVRLAPTGFQATQPVRVAIDHADKTLGVELTADRARYAPGDTVTVNVRTTGPAGHGVGADVIVRAVDEKLFTIGAALDVDSVGALMAAQPDGFLQSFTSHVVPTHFSGGCGGAGGTRDDFRDSATFQHIRTDAGGHGQVTFRVPDDLTSWHVSATAVSSALDSGSGQLLVPVGLPFFVDAILAPEYLVGERPILVARAYGDALTLGDPVRFIVRSADLPLDPVTVDGRVGEAIRVELPALTAGSHRITIEGHAGAGAYEDALTRTIKVVPTRLRILKTAQVSLTTGLAPAGGSGITTVVVTDAGRGSLLPMLQELLERDGARFDQSVAAAVARRLLVDEFGFSADALPKAGYDADRYARSGVALLPYSSPDLFLTALGALVAPDDLNRADAEDALRIWAADPDVTREQRIMALAGVAGL
ncbi:MAG TPA: Ig-like domain-containing protein, partial [Candidatus Acidoferrales bacterium]|nr:Ig-like domain-containing protein [Candidatus Acidoferrales bacterium]